MTSNDIVRAWKDPDYRDQILCGAHDIPAHPSGLVEVDEIEEDVPHGGESAVIPTCTWAGWLCFSIATSIAVSAWLECTGQSICLGTCNDGNSNGCCS